MNRWKLRVVEGYSKVVPVEDFLAVYMETETRLENKVTQIVDACKAQLAKTAKAIKKQKIELKMYPTFVKYVQEIAKNLPKSSRPTFFNTSGTTFHRLHPSDHDTRPDVTASLPGKTPSKIEEWHEVGSVIEFKVDDDPIDTAGSIKPGQLNNLVQLLKNASCILMASASCYVFVVSIFRNNARLFRVDRSGYIVSERFDWSEDVRIFPEFYLRLYTGTKGGILGHDSTTSTPTQTEKQEMFAQLRHLPQYGSMSFEDATDRSRWVKVKLRGDGRAFTVGPPIFQSKGFFGRGTRVERVLIENESPPRMYAMKDAWRQACRLPESYYYEVIQNYADQHCEGKTKGLATCVGSVDLSKSDPKHQKTITAALREGGNALLDRCHDRSLFTPVGFALDQYSSTKQLVQALRNAIIGHELALRAGVMHRDPSAGNVLNDEEDSASPDTGFLLDFDYSDFTDEGLKRFKTLHPGFTLEVVEKGSKDITGTYPFMSLVALRHMKNNTPHTHECHHDLESFYYLLVWILLRHADHDAGAIACSRLFDGEIEQVFNQKWSWLSEHVMSGDAPRLVILNNTPVTTLVQTLTRTFYTQNTFGGTVATHASVLSAFDTALASLDWPDGDAARKFIPPLASLPPLINAGADASYTSSRVYWKDAAKGAVAPQPSTSTRAPEGTAGASGSVKRKRDDKGAVAPQPSTSRRAPEGTAGASGSVKPKRDDNTEKSTQVKRRRR
ncbi:hypothetical protein DFH08DRAFT_19276 [Mycena albidolilacea]|uniref:Fungal-type protein kinase domain-containing protein n=1 Tax=Mycena albidolilacea TaxID=1033008 RepID=A0AAD7F6Z2_9AGAR|nr:hypothetical protein DFH08DRAFT_19276 [Mycena albidolilacea]